MKMYERFSPEIVGQIPYASRISIGSPVQSTTNSRQTLLTVEEVVHRIVRSVTCYCKSSDCPFACKWLPRLPQEDAANGIVPRDGIEEAKNLLPGPHEISLELRQDNIA